MIATATTKGSILRGTTTDSFGDSLDVSTVVATGIPASLIERSGGATRFLTAQPVDQMTRQIRYFTLRLNAGTDIRVGDRFRDDGDGVVYVIDNVSTVQSPVVANDVRCDLRRVT